MAISVESLADDEGESYDAVVASEIIEHVADASVFVAACCALVKVKLQFSSVLVLWKFARSTVHFKTYRYSYIMYMYIYESILFAK